MLSCLAVAVIVLARVDARGPSLVSVQVNSVGNTRLMRKRVALKSHHIALGTPDNHSATADTRAVSKIPCADGYLLTTKNLANPGETIHEKVATSADCGVICDDEVCKAYEYKSDQQRCKTKPPSYTVSGTQKPGWISCEKISCADGFVVTTKNLANPGETSHEHVATSAICGAKCGVHCEAYEYNSDQQRCKTKPPSYTASGTQKPGWISCEKGQPPLPPTCPVGYSGTTENLANNNEQVQNHVASIVTCGEYCSATGCCSAFEYNSGEHTCKMKVAYTTSGTQKPEWVTCVKMESNATKLRVGFVGNSMTYYNNLPHIVQHLLGGSTAVVVGAVLRGASTLGKTFRIGANFREERYIQCDMAQSVQELVNDKSPLDVLVLQDISTGPARKHLRKKGLRTLRDDYAPLLKSTQTPPLVVLYQTFGYERKDRSTKTPRYDFNDLTERLIAGYAEYEKILRSNGIAVEVARVGEAVQKVYEKDRDVWARGYVPDDFHPSPSFTLLAASHIASVISSRFKSLTLQIPKAWPCPSNCHPQSASPRQSDIESVLSIAGPSNAQYVDGQHCAC